MTLFGSPHEKECRQQRLRPGPCEDRSAQLHVTAPHAANGEKAEQYKKGPGCYSSMPQPCGCCGALKEQADGAQQAVSQDPSVWQPAMAQVCPGQQHEQRGNECRE